MNVLDQTVRPLWALYHGDCVEVLRGIPDHSVGYSIFSPPFASLYTYSNSPRDLGNVRDDAEFFHHFGFVIEQLARVLQPGRDVSFHCMLMPTSKVRDGVIGLKDFRGDLIRAFASHGFIYHSEAVIWKDPVTAMQRTKALGLLHKSVRTNASMCRQGIPDYLVTMRAPGDPVERVTHDDYPVEKWQKVASPVWMDIDPNDTLQYRSAREHEDERHICLAGGSLVLTRDGYIQIEDVEVGDLVLTHLGRWKPVIAKKCNGVNDVIRVTAQGVANLICTPDHKLYAKMAKGSRQKEYAMESDPKWVDASETIGSYLNLKLPPVEETDLTDKECWIIGRWLGDGHRGVLRAKHGKHAPIVISCSIDEREDLIAELGEFAGSSQTLTAHQIVIKGLRSEVKRVIDRCGKGASKKRIPAELLTLSQDKARALLDGYLSADGHYVARHDRQVASSVSRALLLGMAMVAQRAHGVVASVYAGRKAGETIIQGRTVKTKQDWVFAYRQTDGYKKSGWIDDGGAWKKVRKIETSDACEVWDLQIADDASFTAEGCIVHNCPLQLEVIRRGIELWTNPGDVVLTPFAGIGSELYVALELGRRAIGVELKESYYRQAVANLTQAGSQVDLFESLAS